MTGRTVARRDGVSGPHRTCVACRRVRPQSELIRLTRAPAGTLETDPGRRRPGRGAYLCPREACLDESLRRARFTQAFRAPTTATPDVIERVRRWLDTESRRSTIRSMTAEGRG